MIARIGNCSGYYGDRFTAMRELLETAELDYLTGDYLAELTMLILGRDQLKDPSRGYARTFLRQLRDCLALARERGVRIVANAGGLHPAGLATSIRELAAEQGLQVRVAHVEGDDLRDRTAELGVPEALTANAYLGSFGITAALDAGADVVVTGRVTDAAPLVGSAAAHHGWDHADLDALAGAVVAGHVVECGTQATGGNFSGFIDIDRRRPLGFPIAEVAADGSSVITKPAGTGGAVTIDTVTAQLVYEIQTEAYLGPDVTAHLGSVALAQEGPDRVRIGGVRGSPPPAGLKVGLSVLGGHRNSVELLLSGLDVEEKAAWVRAQVGAEFERAGVRPREIEWQLDRRCVDDPATQAEATSVLRCHVRDDDPETVGRSFSDVFVQLALASYPGFALTRPPSAGTPYGVFRVGIVGQDEVRHAVVLDDGRRLVVDPPPTSDARPPVASAPGRSHPAAAPPGPPGPPGAPGRSVPLGRLVHARSGDKGGDANVGVWIPADHPRRADAVAWLLGFLTAEQVRTLVPEATELPVEVYPLPNLGAVNIVLPGLLGEGVAASTRLDPQAKGLGEWLRARHAPIPEVLLPPYPADGRATREGDVVEVSGGEHTITGPSPGGAG